MMIKVLFVFYYLQISQLLTKGSRVSFGKMSLARCTLSAMVTSIFAAIAKRFLRSLYTTLKKTRTSSRLIPKRELFLLNAYLWDLTDLRGTVRV